MNSINNSQNDESIFPEYLKRFKVPFNDSFELKNSLNSGEYSLL